MKNFGFNGINETHGFGQKQRYPGRRSLINKHFRVNRREAAVAEQLRTPLRMRKVLGSNPGRTVSTFTLLMVQDVFLGARVSLIGECLEW